MYLIFLFIFRMASGFGSGGNENDNPDYVVSGNKSPALTPPTPNSDSRFTAIVEQLVKSQEDQAQMQAHITTMLQVQNQLQVQM